jgi:hypothetical protein
LGPFLSRDGADAPFALNRSCGGAEEKQQYDEKTPPRWGGTALTYGKARRLCDGVAGLLGFRFVNGALNRGTLLSQELITGAASGGFDRIVVVFDQ